MARTAINLYTVRDLDEPLLDIVDRVADAGYDGIQLQGGFWDAWPAETGARIEERGLDVAPAQVGIEILEDTPKSTLADYRDTLGCHGLVAPYLDRTHFDSPDAVDETADRLSTLAEELGEHGLALHYHNHDHEFVEMGEETAFDRFIRRVEDVTVEFDVGWGLAGGVDPVTFIETHGDRINHLHMKDIKKASATPCEIGTGDVDMAACAAAGREAGVEWLVYEHDHPEDPATSIETGAQFLDEL